MDATVIAMNILEAVKERRSIRAFQEKAIPQEALDQIIEAILWAPSAGNLQSRFFYFVFERKLKTKLARAALDQFFISDAPLAIVACCDLRIEGHYGRRGRDLYTIQDVAASIQNLMLVAHEIGLGSVWVGAFDEKKVFETLEIPNHLRPVAIVPVGYPAEFPSPPPRVAKKDAVTIIRS